MPEARRVKDWSNLIASRSRENVELVKEVLHRHRVRPSPNVGNPRRLTIKSIQFSGKKSGQHNEAFEFAWNSLDAGLWGLVSDRNLKGKTTIIEVARWLLRGKSSTKLQDGVKSWFSEASLEFEIDKTIYVVSLNQNKNDNNILGSLWDKGKQLRISSFQSEEEFEACMSDFMMRNLSLDVLTAWRGGKEQGLTGKSVLHDWSAISGVLFVGSDYQAIFGDLVADGLNNRLMNVYLGLPWIPTLSALLTAQSRLQEEKKVASYQSSFAENQLKERRLRIIREIEACKSALKETSSDADLRRDLNEANQHYAESTRRLRLTEEEHVRIEREKGELYAMWVQDKRDYQNFREASAAGAVFKALNPSCCPHCQTSISEERKLREISEHSCSICGEHISDSEDSSKLEKEFKERLNSSKIAREQVDQKISEIKIAIEACQTEVSRYGNECVRLEGEIKGAGDRYKLESKISGLEFLLSEYSDDNKPEEESARQPDIDIDLKIIKAAIAETKKRIQDLQVELLEEVSEKIKEYATCFGMTSITSVTMTSHPHLRLQKDGGETSYSKCTKGEKLRLKIASIVALISIAEERGVGRHPGLLFIDSPGSEEIVDNDIDQLVGGLSELARKLPHIQVIIAAISSESILRHIEPSHHIHAKGDACMW